MFSRSSDVSQSALPGRSRRRRGWRMRQLAVGGLILVVAAVATLAASGLLHIRSAAATASAANTPILFVHGFDGNVPSCPGYEIGGSTTFGSIVTYFHTAGNPGVPAGGWTGPMDELLYYPKDTANDNLGVDGHVVHDITHSSKGGSAVDDSLYYGSTGATTCNGTGTVDGTSVPDRNENADIKHLAYNLAWYIRWHYPAQPVDIIDHSMGGLIARWMLYAEQNPSTVGSNDFPAQSYVDVQNVVDVSAPNNGANLGCLAFWLVQGKEMCGGSSFLASLNGSASGQDPQNPAGASGTAWTTLGSEGDTTVAYKSATYMSAAVHKVVYKSPAYTHGGYLTDSATTLDATIAYCASCSPGISDSTAPYVTSATQPHAIQEMSRALQGVFP